MTRPSRNGRTPFVEQARLQRFISHRVCPPYPSLQGRIAPSVSMMSVTGRLLECAKYGGSPWGSRPGPVHLFCVQYLLLAISSASLTFFRHRFSMETPFMRSAAHGKIWQALSVFDQDRKNVTRERDCQCDHRTGCPKRTAESVELRKTDLWRSCKDLSLE